jgi:hypothetical protein
MSTNYHQPERREAEKRRMKPTTDDISSPLLECPFCDCAHHHVERVGTELDPSDDKALICNGTSLVFERSSKDGHQSAVRIDFRGICGHRWSLILQQYKGVMKVYARAIETPPRTREEWEAARRHAELLRDPMIAAAMKIFDEENAACASGEENSQ